MKKYILALFTLTTLWSCHTDAEYEDLNRDPKTPTEVDAAFLFTGATDRLAHQMATPNVNRNIFRFLAQYLTATTYLDEPNYDLTNRNIPQTHWSILYRNVIFDLQDARQRVMDDPDLSQSEIDARLGQIEVIEVYAWHVLVDSFGDIPYSDALNPQEVTLPAYDDAASIYEDLISRLDAAASNLEAGEGFSQADIVYGGDMNKWYKFANSLQLRLAMRIADSNPGLSQSTAEDAVARGVFESNDDSATVAFQSNPPNTNPLWEDLVQSGRSDYVAANTIIDYMQEFDDPRIDDYFDENLDEGYVGGTYGASSAFAQHTHVDERFLDPTLPAILQDYAEVEFYLAEAAARNYSVPGSAEEHYEQAITASILFYGGTEAQAEQYLDQPDVAYDASEWRQQIGTQFWIAMFDNPFQGWSVWRKYDAPELNIAAQSGNPVPFRLTYPVNEQNLNEANYEEAAAAIGGDEQRTRLFWDVQ